MTTQTLLPTMQRFEPPTLNELLSYAYSIGMPKEMAEECWFHYDSNGWKVGKNKMVSWHSATSGWFSRNKPRAINGKPQLTGADKMIYHEELKRCLAQIERIRAVDSHCDIRAEDKARLKELNARKKELKEMLGVKI